MNWEVGTVDKSDVMNSKRSTRRSVNPPEGGTGEDQASEVESLADVDSILNEIEDLVSSSNSTSDETARPTSVVEHLNPNDQPESAPEAGGESSEGFEDIRQLTDELDAAIASELSRVDDTSVPSQMESTEKSMIQNDDVDATDPVEEADSTESVPRSEESDEPEDADDPAPQEADQVCVSLPHRMLALCSTPMRGLSTRNQLIVSLFAISMALWVPLIWTLAMTTEQKNPLQVPENGVLVEGELDSGRAIEPNE